MAALYLARVRRLSDMPHPSLCSGRTCLPRRLREAPLDTYRHDVPDEWRILATLNDRDRDLLFDIPYALLRRFAVIQVPNPPTLYQRLLDEKADTGSVELNRRLAALTKLPHRSLQRMTRTWGEAQLLS